MFKLPFFIAVQFLTKFPIHLPRIPTAEENAYSVLFYPIIGFLIGVLLYGIAYYFPATIMLKSAIIMIFWLWLTGGLHLDGLADTVDGFVGGYGDKEKTLMIMKDPHIGAMGVMAIVGALILKFICILELCKQNRIDLLIFIPILGRLSILLLLLIMPYIRHNGLGAVLSQYLPKKLTIITLIFGLLSVFLLDIKIAIMILSIWWLTCGCLMYWFKKRIGGITGDTLGASVEIIEIMVLILCNIFLYLN